LAGVFAVLCRADSLVANFAVGGCVAANDALQINDLRALKEWQLCAPNPRRCSLEIATPLADLHEADTFGEIASTKVFARSRAVRAAPISHAGSSGVRPLSAQLSSESCDRTTPQDNDEWMTGFGKASPRREGQLCQRQLPKRNE